MLVTETVRQLTDTDSDANLTDRPLSVCPAEEGELSDLEQDLTPANIDKALSEEQTYRETMRGIRSFMGWKHIPDVDTATSDAGDNPFAEPNQQLLGKISVNILTDDWLCKKLDKLNRTLVEGYLSRSSEAR